MTRPPGSGNVVFVEQSNRKKCKFQDLESYDPPSPCSGPLATPLKKIIDVKELFIEINIYMHRTLYTIFSDRYENKADIIVLSYMICLHITNKEMSQSLSKIMSIVKNSKILFHPTILDVKK
jgi:hypothetical protein